MARSSYLSGKLPNHQREPIHNPNNGRGQEEAEEGMRGRKARRRRVAGGSFTNLGHRESELGGAGVREGALRQEASSGRRQKRWEKTPCCMRDSQRRRPLLKGIPESTHFSFLPVSAPAAAGCQNRIGHGPDFHSLRKGVSSQSRTAVASLLPRTMEGSLPTEVKSVYPLRADLTARRQCRKSSFYRTLI